MNALADAIAAELKQRLLIEIEASGRHVHLCQEDLDRLFGPGHQLTRVKDLSQPGQYVCQERVSLHGPKGSLERVVVLGPLRKETQAEISLTDAVVLGLTPPVRQSGDLSGSPGLVIEGPRASIQISQGLIAAQRHVHMTPRDAQSRGLSDGDVVRLKCFTSRPLIFDDVVVRVSEHFATICHIDYDEANACGFHKGDLGLILPEAKTL